uniref:GP-PDE domain-containing protein n=1 Tax=Glossina brevipalpis TaxID=37001 RepID=A0A1A9W3P0_9MUSC
MSLLKYLFAILVVVVGILTTLPNATRCETSYYEKYYSARRVVPPKHPSMLQLNISVSLLQVEMNEFEQVAVVGDLKELGQWQANSAVILNRSNEYGIWKTTVQVPVNITINYRYFIAAIDQETSGIQIRRWESHLHPRMLTLSINNISVSDQFGLIGDHTMPEQEEREIQRGWLNIGRIVQFKLFRNPLQVNNSAVDIVEGQQLRIKLQPVDPTWRTPIMPSAKAFSEYARYEYGNSFLKTQPEYGVPYDENSIILFHTTVTELLQVAFLFQLYAEDIRHNSIRVIGYQYVYPSVLENTSGSLELTLLSPIWLNAMGSLAIEYLIIKPLTEGYVDFHTSFMNYWRTNWTNLEVGHRGLGKSLRETVHAPPAIENTLAAMHSAVQIGIDMVEFDVILTKDLIPIIYHDFNIYVCEHSKTPKISLDLTEVAIKDITYEQLKDLKTYQIIGTKIIEFPSHNSIEDENLRLFPSFEDFLTKVNKSLGFDIEIKWPQQLKNGSWESRQTIDENLYIDRILEVMLRHGCGRFSFFSCLDADIGTILRYKQNMYPIMFITSFQETNYMDPRSDTIYEAIDTAQMFDFVGVISYTGFIKAKSSWIQMVLKQNKKIFLYGPDFKDRDSIDWFLQQHVTGVIYDRVDLYWSTNKTSIFLSSPDLPEFFQLQCPSSNQYSNSNSNSMSTDVFINCWSLQMILGHHLFDYILLKTPGWID